jgi:hypothetical protein
MTSKEEIGAYFLGREINGYFYGIATDEEPCFPNQIPIVSLCAGDEIATFQDPTVGELVAWLTEMGLDQPEFAHLLAMIANLRDRWYGDDIIHVPGLKERHEIRRARSLRSRASRA